MSNCTNNSAMCGFAQQTRGSLVNIIAVIGTFSRLSPLDPTRHPAGESTGEPTRVAVAYAVGAAFHPFYPLSHFHTRADSGRKMRIVHRGVSRCC
jgi:hypothetical protein